MDFDQIFREIGKIGIFFLCTPTQLSTNFKKVEKMNLLAQRQAFVNT